MGFALARGSVADEQQVVPRRCPRVAIFSENGIDGACTDIACLLHGMLVTPLNVHFDAETVAWIVDRLNINMVVTDSDERIARLAEVRVRSVPRGERCAAADFAHDSS